MEAASHSVYIPWTAEARPNLHKQNESIRKRHKMPTSADLMFLKEKNDFTQNKSHTHIYTCIYIDYGIVTSLARLQSSSLSFSENHPTLQAFCQCTKSKANLMSKNINNLVTIIYIDIIRKF